VTVALAQSKRFADTVAPSIVYLYDESATGEPKNLLGTAFLVGVPAKTPGQYVPVVVTARHVLGDRAKVLGRFNAEKGGAPRYAEYDVAALKQSGDYWEHPDAGVDVVAFRTPIFDGIASSLTPLDSVASREDFDRLGVDVTDKVVLPSLMQAVPGATHNTPIFRDGSIAMLAGDPIPLKFSAGSREVKTQQALILINSTVNEGYSGAPMFLWPDKGTSASGHPLLLGVVHGYYHTVRRVVDEAGNPVATTGSAQSASGAKEGMFVRENSAVGIAFPAWRLREILDSAAVRRRVDAVTASSQALVAGVRLVPAP
jgi:hypothetical protein